MPDTVLSPGTTEVYEMGSLSKVNLLQDSLSSLFPGLV